MVYVVLLQEASVNLEVELLMKLQHLVHKHRRHVQFLHQLVHVVLMMALGVHLAPRPYQVLVLDRIKEMEQHVRVSIVEQNVVVTLI